MEKINPRQSLTPQSSWQHLYPGSPRLRTLHSPRQLILISHSFDFVIPASKSSVLASYFELAFAVLQFSFLCLLADKRSARLSSSEQKAVAEERDGQYSTVGHQPAFGAGSCGTGQIRDNTEPANKKGKLTVTRTANTQRVFLLQASPFSLGVMLPPLDVLCDVSRVLY